MRVVLVHDASHDVQAVRAALSPDAVTLEASTSLAMVTGMIQKSCVDAVLVCVNGMDDPKIDLVRRWRHDGVYAGSLVLLCPGRVAEDAYRLCREEVFDDYVFVEPMHDAFRLRLALNRALAMRVHEQTRLELATLSDAVVGVRGAAAGATRELSDDWTEVLPRLRRMLELLEERGTQGASASSREQGVGLMAAVEQLQRRQQDAFASVDRQVGLIDASLARARSPDDRLLLLIDDDPAFAELFDVMVSSLTYRLTSTTEPHTALRLIKDLCPALVFLDVDMPQMSGMDLLRAIRADKIVGATPVILMTGKRDIDTVLAAKRLNVDGYLVKPPPASEVAAKLEAILSRP